ncbi:MAG: helix-turn-helix domain-containing protein [Dehalococcoidia bacterium]
MDEQLVSVKHAAKRLDVSESKLRKWIRNGNLEALKFGYHVRIPLRAIEAHLRPASGEEKGR